MEIWELCARERWDWIKLSLATCRAAVKCSGSIFFVLFLSLMNAISSNIPLELKLFSLSPAQNVKLLLWDAFKMSISSIPIIILSLIQVKNKFALKILVYANFHCCLLARRCKMQMSVAKQLQLRIMPVSFPFCAHSSGHAAFLLDCAGELLYRHTPLDHALLFAWLFCRCGACICTVESESSANESRLCWLLVLSCDAARLTSRARGGRPCVMHAMRVASIVTHIRPSFESNVICSFSLRHPPHPPPVQIYIHTQCC